MTTDDLNKIDTLLAEFLSSSGEQRKDVRVRLKNFIFELYLRAYQAGQASRDRGE